MLVQLLLLDCPGGYAVGKETLAVEEDRDDRDRHDEDRRHEEVPLRGVLLVEDR